MASSQRDARKYGTAYCGCVGRTSQSDGSGGSTYGLPRRRPVAENVSSQNDYFPALLDVRYALRQHSIRTVLPSLSPPRALLATQQCFASLQAVATDWLASTWGYWSARCLLPAIFHRSLSRLLCGGLMVIEWDVYRDAGATNASRTWATDGQAMQGSRGCLRPRLDIYGFSGMGQVRRRGRRCHCGWR